MELSAIFRYNCYIIIMLVKFTISLQRYFNISTEHKQIIGKMTGIKETKPKTPRKNRKRGVNSAWGRRENHKGRRGNARRIVENPQRT